MTPMSSLAWLASNRWQLVLSQRRIFLPSLILEVASLGPARSSQSQPAQHLGPRPDERPLRRGPSQCPGNILGEAVLKHKADP